MFDIVSFAMWDGELDGHVFFNGICLIVLNFFPRY